MKKAFVFLFFMALVFANMAIAQTSPAQDTLGIPDSDWARWNIFGLNAIVIVRILGEIYSSLKNGGGLVGIGRAILYGQNVPKAIATDYHEELKVQKQP